MSAFMIREYPCTSPIRCAAEGGGLLNRNPGNDGTTTWKAGSVAFAGDVKASMTWVNCEKGAGGQPIIPRLGSTGSPFSLRETSLAIRESA